MCFKSCNTPPPPAQARQGGLFALSRPISNLLQGASLGMSPGATQHDAPPGLAVPGRARRISHAPKNMLRGTCPSPFQNMPRRTCHHPARTRLLTRSKPRRSCAPPRDRRGTRRSVHRVTSKPSSASQRASLSAPAIAPFSGTSVPDDRHAPHSRSIRPIPRPAGVARRHVVAGEGRHVLSSLLRQPGLVEVVDAIQRGSSPR